MKALSNLPDMPKLEQTPARRMSDRKKRAADIMVDILAKAGVRAVFGIPGGTISPLFDALIDHPEIRVVTTKHESQAVFAAAGYAFTTGQLAVVLTTSGPGVLNALTGLASAQMDSLPILMIAGECSRDVHGRGALQEGSAYGINVIGMAKSICKMAIEVPEASAVPALLRRAITTAITGKKGAVIMTIPMNVSRAITNVPEISSRTTTSYEFDEVAIDAAAKALSRSPTKVIFAGSGVRRGRGPQLLKELAERLQCPVMTTPKAKGVFPEDHPLALGVHGIGGHPSTQELLQAGVETVLAIGTSLSDLATNGWSKLLIPTRTFIHVDIEASQLGRAYPTTLSIASSAEAFFDEMLLRCSKSLTAKTFGVKHHQSAELMTSNTPGLIAPARAIWELQQVLPKDTIFTVDSGEHTVWVLHYLQSRLSDSFMVMMGLASMAASVGSAIGAKLGQKDRNVTVLCGDGGFAMACAEVATAAQEKLPINFVVFNDQKLGMVELGHMALYGRTPSYSTGPMDIAAMGRACGAQAMVIDRPGQILEAGILTEKRDHPLVLDIRVDGSLRMPRNARFEALGAKVKTA